MPRLDMDAGRDLWLRESASAEEAYERFGSDFLRPEDSAGDVLDSHSFRHGYVSAICRADVSPKAMMDLARRSDPRLTLKRYAHMWIADAAKAKALGMIPAVLADGPQPEAPALRATGTDHVRAEAVQAAQDAPRSPRIEDRGAGGDTSARRGARGFGGGFGDSAGDNTQARRRAHRREHRRRSRA